MQKQNKKIIFAEIVIIIAIMASLLLFNLIGEKEVSIKGDGISKYTLSDLNKEGVTIGCLLGTGVSQYLKNNYDKAEILLYNTNEDVYAAVDSGAITCGISYEGSVKKVVDQYENATPLKDINCEIEKGEVISIIGPSGCGKSTFINCINRLETPTSGKIIFDGIDITDKDCNIYDIRKRIGMVFQSFNLFSHLTILENAMLAPIEVLHADKDKLYKACMEMFEMVGLKDKVNSYPDELSGGQQQRAALIRTIAMDPEVILFDEPTSALDPTTVSEIEQDIKNLGKLNYTMLIVTHDMRFAKNIASRVFYIDEGIIYEESTPDEIFDNPKKEKTKAFMEMVKNKGV